MVGSSPDSFDIKSPLSNLITGKRYAYNKGNAGFAPLWKLNNLPNGTYYWRVQAIDNSLAASCFSDIDSFVIKGRNLPPEISDLTINVQCNSNNYIHQQLADAYSDFEGDSMQGVVIKVLPSSGTLLLNFIPVVVDQVINVSELDDLCYYTSVIDDDFIYVKPYNEHGTSIDSFLINFNVLLFKSVFAIDNYRGDVAWGDYDNDGKIDFACCTGIFHNTGVGFEQLADSVPVAESIFWADVNNDGWLDCLYGGFVMINNGAGHFIYDTVLVNWKEIAGAVGDINNDNNIDYIMSGMDFSDYGNPKTRIFINQNSSLSNNNVNNDIVGFRSGAIDIGDANNDGYQDIIINGIFDQYNSRQTLFYRNDGGEFHPYTLNLPGVNVGSLNWGDFDRDGDLDLLLCGSFGTVVNSTTKLFENINSTFFVEHSTFVPLAQGEAIWYDFDADGFLDVIASGLTCPGYLENNYEEVDSYTYLYRNVNGERFEAVDNTGIKGLGYTKFDVSDFDGDGFEDLIVSGQTDNNTSHIIVYRNGLGNGDEISLPTNLTPINLTSEVVGSSVKLTWNSLYDSSYTYNLYVKDSSGFVISPVADITTGFRKITANGNVGSQKHYEISGLDAGTYFWSVQVIGKDRKGGIFAPEQSFSINCSKDTVEIYDTVCFAYEKDNRVMYESGNYAFHYTNINGCDSIVLLHLTIVDTCTPIIYVSENSLYDLGDNYWQNTISDLQMAMNIAKNNNCQVWVAKGTYYGDGLSAGAFVIPDGVDVYGGFEGNESDNYDLSLRDFRKNRTVLDGQNVQTTLQKNATETGEGSIIDDCTIQHGTLNVNGGAFLTIRNCIIQDGGEVLGGWGNSIMDCKIVNSIISNISCHLYNSSLLHFNATNCLIRQCTYRGSVVWGSNLTNCIIANNNPVYLSQEDIGSNQYQYCAVQGFQVEGEGNIYLADDNTGTDPAQNYVRFVSPESGDFTLMSSSACINAGTPNTNGLDLLSTDMQGFPRIMDNRIDIGPYEFFPVPVFDLSDTICSTDHYNFFGDSIISSGVYVHHSNIIPSLDTIFRLNLTVQIAYIIDTIISLSNVQSSSQNGTNIDHAGEYVFNLSASNGCDSIIHLRVYDDIVSICENSLPYSYEDTVFELGTITGNYVFHTNNNDLKSIYLEISPVSFSYDTIDLCDDDFEDVVEEDTVFLQSSCGCDSLLYLHIRKHRSYHIITYDTTVQGFWYSFRGQNYGPGHTQESTSYLVSYTTVAGCDSIYIIDLTVVRNRPKYYVKVNGTGDGSSWENAMGDLQAAMDSAALVQGDVWVAQGTYYGDGVSENAFVIPDGVHVYGGFAGNEPANYDLTLRDFATHPTILDGQHMQRTVYHDWTWNLSPVLDGFTIRNGHSSYGGNVYGGEPKLQMCNCTVQGGVSDGEGGGLCNASIRNSVIINNTSSYWGSAMRECEAYNCLITGNNATEYGYTAQWCTLTNCIVWNNIGYPDYDNSITYSAVERQEVWGEGNIMLAYENDGSSPDSNYVRFMDPENGNFRLSYGSACINAGTPDISELELPSVDLQGLPRVLDGRIDMGAYEYYPVPIVETYDTACEGNGFAFFDSICTATGNYVHHTNVLDVTLDTLYVLHLTVNQSSFGDTTAVACESYMWNSTTYAQSGDYTQTFSAANGCDSVVTLHLTITNTDHTDFTDEACDSYSWNGETYTQSGDYTQSFTNSVGCDSVVTLHLTITNTDHTDFTDEACDSYTWNGETFTQSGTYSQTFTNSSGCDSVVTLHLTVNYGTHNVVTETACESFTWHGTEYTASGTYTYEYTNASGCASVDTLHLTINFAQSAQFAVTTTDSCYTWNAETYCESGDYTQTLTATNGCDSTVTLHLTVSVGIDDHNDFAFKLYPNPTNGVVNVQCTMHNVQAGAMEFHVFDAYGKLVDVVEMNTHGSSAQTAQIDLSGFAAGVYFVKAVADGNVVAVKKVVKQ